jgi:hypothetical protein
VNVDPLLNEQRNATDDLFCIYTKMDEPDTESDRILYGTHRIRCWIHPTEYPNYFLHEQAFSNIAEGFE